MSSLPPVCKSTSAHKVLTDSGSRTSNFSLITSPCREDIASSLLAVAKTRQPLCTDNITTYVAAMGCGLTLSSSSAILVGMRSTTVTRTKGAYSMSKTSLCPKIRPRLFALESKHLPEHPVIRTVLLLFVLAILRSTQITTAPSQSRTLSNKQ